MCNGGNIAGGVGMDLARFDYVPDIYEFDATDATGSDVKTITLQGLNEQGLDHVLIASIDSDKGVGAGTAAVKEQVRVSPQVQKGLGGGDVWHTYATRDTFKQTSMPFGLRLRPNEDCMIEFRNRTNPSTVRVRVVRFRAFARR